MRHLSLLCVVDKNKKGDWELTPVVNLPEFFTFSEREFDIERELGKYYKVRSSAVQRRMRSIYFVDGFYSNVVVAYFEEKTNLVLKNIFAIKFGKEPKMSTSANCLVNIKSVTNPTPAAVRKELEAIASVKGLFPLVNIAYAAVSQNRIEVKVAVAMEQGVARKVADILAQNGALVEVIEQGTGTLLYSPAAKAVAEKKPAVAKAIEKIGEVDPDYFYIPQVLRDISNVLGALSKTPNFSHESLIISGPSGWGKTGFTVPLAKALGMKVECIDMSMVLETEELYGTRQIKNGDTTFEFNHFVQAVEQGNTIVVLDEINRTYAGALNSLFPLMDWRGETVIHGRKIKCGPRTIFIATRNVGSSYVGTQASDSALVSRFGFAAIVDSMPVSEEVTLLTQRTGVSKSEASLIVKAANQVREQRELGVNVSPRNTLAIAAMVKVGIDPRAAFQWNVVLKEEEQEVRVQLENIFNRTMSKDYGVAMDTSKLPSIF